MPGRNIVQGPLLGALASATAPSSIAALAQRSGVNLRSVKFRVGLWARIGVVEVLAAEPTRWRPACNDQPPSSSDAGRRIWDALVHLAPVAAPGLVAATGLERGHVWSFLQAWLARGLVTQMIGAPVRYALPAADTPLALPLPKRSGRERMWSAMRVLRQFDLPTLAIAAETTRKSAQDYIGALLAAGFLAKLNDRRPGPGEWSSYRLIRRSGRKSPVVRVCRNAAGQRERAVLDPNAGSIHPITRRDAAADNSPFCAPADVNHVR